MARKLTIVAFLAALALPVAHAETPAPVLQSLPAELQQNIEQVRTACREALNGAREALLALGGRGLSARGMSFRPLVDMPNDDVSPVDIGTDAASQLHIIEMDNGHSKLGFKPRKAFRGPVYDHLGCDGRYVQKSTGCLGSFGVTWPRRR